MKLLRLLLLLIHVFVGLGALAGGYACLVDPVTPLGATTAMLQASPFSTFLIPGIVLFGLFGVGNRNFAELFCVTAKTLSKEYEIPLLHTFEFQGSPLDVKKMEEELLKIEHDD